MNILGLIPARGGSKGVPGKNIRPLNGKPLLAYTAETALSTKLLSEVVLSSDDDQIIAIGKELGLSVPFKRPAHLALDTTPTLDVIVHALEFYGRQNIFFDAVCLLQPTSPFRSVNFLEKAIVKFKESGCDSLVSVRKVPHEYNPHWTFFEKDGKLSIATGDAKLIPRRQELPQAFHRDGSIYLTKTNVILERNSLYGDSMAFCEADHELHVNIDTTADWEKAEMLAKQYSKR